MKKICALAAAVAFTVSGAAMADDGPNSIVVDISGAQSWGFQGDPLNEHMNVPGFNPGDIIHSIKYDIVLTTIDPSWADEPRIGVSDGANGVVVVGPFGSATTVTSAPYSGTANVGGYVMTGNRLDLEFYESGFDDHTGVDAIYNQGTLVINYTAVPAPAVLAMLGAAGLVSRRRRRA